MGFDKNIYSKGQKPKGKRVAVRLPTSISKDEFLILLGEAKERREKFRAIRSRKLSPRGIRLNQYIICMVLGFGSGMRISEVLGYSKGEEIIVPKLERSQIEANLIRVVSGKGNKDRQVPLPIKVFRKAGITRAEFVNNLPLKISRSIMQKFIKEIGYKKLNKRITFHTLRHGFATTCIENGMDITQLQLLIGHSRLDTTSIYLHINPKKALEKYDEIW